MKTRLNLLFMFASLIFWPTFDLVYAADKVIVVPLFGNGPNSGVAAIPVYCRSTYLSTTATSQANVVCYRADTRTSVTPVPDGHFLFITDISVHQNNSLSEGTARITVGVNTGTHPSSPRYHFAADFSQLQTVSFTSPYLVFHAGENIGAYNGDVSSTARGANVIINGYLIKADGFGG